MKRAVDHDLAEVEADHGRRHAAPRRRGRRNPGHEPFVASASQRRLPTFAEAAYDVPAATGDEAEQDRLEAVSVRHTPAVATGSRFTLLLAFGQVAGDGLQTASTMSGRRASMESPSVVGFG